MGIASTANDVHLKDGAIPEGLRVIDGSPEASLGKVDSGSSVQHSYVVVADKGSFGAEFEPATVSYIPEFDSKEIQVCIVQWASCEPGAASSRSPALMTSRLLCLLLQSSLWLLNPLS